MELSKAETRLSIPHPVRSSIERPFRSAPSVSSVPFSKSVQAARARWEKRYRADVSPSMFLLGFHRPSSIFASSVTSRMPPSSVAWGSRLLISLFRDDGSRISILITRQRSKLLEQSRQVSQWQVWWKCLPAGDFCSVRMSQVWS